MNNTMSYKGYTARIEYSAEDQCFVGHIAGIIDIVGFHGESVNELHQSFEEAVNDYLETCKKVGKAPQQADSGELILRIPPQIHAAIANAAKMSGKSLNQWAVEALSLAK
ncbi:MAG: toxin-antitoxin system HicB family antitoxin [Candidatus Parabeggiatoa sp. nov. 1]|nr:MAG: toxin-antitoxin system HicB family antitoxin [Gammaproteobacteria bacterium]